MLFMYLYNFPPLLEALLGPLNESQLFTSKEIGMGLFALFY